MKFFESTDGYNPYTKEAINAMIAGFLRRRNQRKPNAVKGFIMRPDVTAPLTHKEALPGLKKKKGISS